MLEINGVGACLHPIYLVSIHKSVSFCKYTKISLLERATSNFSVLSSRNPGSVSASNLLFLFIIPSCCDVIIIRMFGPLSHWFFDKGMWSPRLYLYQTPFMIFANLSSQCVGSVICKGHAAGCAPCYFFSFFISCWIIQISLLGPHTEILSWHYWIYQLKCVPRVIYFV